MARRGEVTQMPLYEFRCSECESTTEVYVPAHEVPTRYCERCGRELRLLVSRPGWFRPGLYGKAGGLK